MLISLDRYLCLSDLMVSWKKPHSVPKSHTKKHDCPCDRMRPGDSHVITEADVGRKGPFGTVLASQVGNVVTRLDVGWSEETAEAHKALRKVRSRYPEDDEDSDIPSTRERILRGRWHIYSDTPEQQAEEAERSLNAALALGERAVMAGTPPSKALSQYVVPTMEKFRKLGAHDTEAFWYATERLEMAEEKAQWGEK